MFRTLLLLMVVVCLAIPMFAVQGATEEILPAGMLLQCTLDEPRFSSATSEIGDPVLCSIGTLGVFGHSIFPRGAYLAGRFQDFRDPGRFFGKGWMGWHPPASTRCSHHPIVSEDNFRPPSQSRSRRKYSRSWPSQARRHRLGRPHSVAGQAAYLTCTWPTPDTQG